MTMPHPHPDDERLAAYAGGDAEARVDPSLVSHLASCVRCRPIVDEISLLRGALAELPNLDPSRPLRLIPPVASPDAGTGSWLRRLTAPAMAAGAALILVGAVGIGATGAIGGFFGQAASGIFQNVGENLQGPGAPGAEITPSDNANLPGVMGSPAPTSGGTRGSNDSAGSPISRYSPEASPTGADFSEDRDQGSPDEQPWLTLLIAGTGLFVISTALRFSISPRSG